MLRLAELTERVIALVDYLLDGPPDPPSGCPASITHYGPRRQRGDH